MISKINFQPPLKQISGDDGQRLLVHSIFFTIQGEGPHVGKPAVFVRLGGCNLQCPGCDTDYSNGTSWESVDSILTRIGMAFGGYKGQRLVVITGGEPFRQNIIPLVNRLTDNLSHAVQVESNGTLGLQVSYVEMNRIPRWNRSYFSIVVSPKAGKVNPELFPFITAYKYVLDICNIDPKDGLPTSVLGLPAAPARPHVGFEGSVYVQPADQRNEEDNKFNLEACVEIAKRHGYRVGIQTHKLMGVE